MLDLRGKNKVVGAKQTKRALQGGGVVTVYLAQDASKEVTEPITALCVQQGLVPVVIESMSLLGQACALQVGASVAAVFHEV